MLQGGVIIGPIIHEHGFHKLNGFHDTFLKSLFDHSADLGIPLLGQLGLWGHYKKALGVTLFNGLVELKSPFGLLFFLCISMAECV